MIEFHVRYTIGAAVIYESDLISAGDRERGTKSISTTLYVSLNSEKKNNRTKEISRSVNANN